MPPGPVTEFAPAKINLCLHVTGRRADGYHLLDSLVVFAGVGDQVRAEPASTLTLACDGPFGAVIPAGDDNLVLRAARHLGGPGAAITLTKVLPPASGIGGGSADAAATLRALLRLAGADPVVTDPATLATLGADVPACFMGRPLRLRGIGEQLDPLAHPLPPAWFVLVNPRVEVPTPRVFAALERRENPPLPDHLPQGWHDAGDLAAFLHSTRNDLEPPARATAPVIGDVLAALAATPACLLARMSGSGATCFGLYATEPQAHAAAAAIIAGNPGWWVAPAPMLSGVMPAAAADAGSPPRS
jgi:4-diphosphocytidyl-2-C-methyl-D-erythritol kinase